MEGNSANAPEPAPQKPPSKPKEQEKANDQETFEIQAGPVKIKGRQNFVLALVLGVLGGAVIFYLVLFQLRRPQVVYRLLVEEPFYQTLTAAPTATPLPPRTVEVTREVTRVVPTVFVTRETVVVTSEVVRRETVVVTQIVPVPETVVVRPSPTPIPGASQILEIGEDNPVGVFIPIGIAHGFVALTDAALTYLVDNYYDGDDELGVAWNDPALGLTWGISNPILSPRDLQNWPLKDIPPHQLPD